MLPKQWEPGVSYLVTREAGTKAHRAREKGGLGFQNLATQSAPQVATSNLQAIYGFLHLDTLALDPLEKGDV